MPRFFNTNEFDSPDELGSGSRMDAPFLELLDDLRDKVGQPFIILSGYRTAAHNQAVGGEDNSSHLRGKAVDIKVVSSMLRFRVIEQAMKMGIRRMGIGGTFIHIDIDLSLPQDVIWLYPTSVRR